MKWIYVLLCLLSVCTGLVAQDKIGYDTLLNRVNRLPSEEIIKLGDDYLKGQHMDTAIVLYSIAFSRYSNDASEEEKKFCAIGYLKTANVYYLQGNYTGALELYIKGLKIYESCKDKTELMRFYNNIGNIYCIFADYERGISYYEKGYALCKQYPNKEVEYNLLTNLAGICCFTKDIEKAKKYYLKTEKMKQPNDTIKNYMSIFNWGLILVSEGKLREAMQSFHRSVDFAQRCQMNSEYLCTAYQQLYEAFKQINREDSTIYYLHLCNELAEKNNQTHLFIQTLKDYSVYYERKGNTEKAQYYKSKYLAITDSIYNVREFNKVKNTQFLYEIGKTNKEISDLHAEQEMKEQKIKQQQRILAGIITSLVIISSLLILVYQQKRKIQRSYRDLFNINRDVVVSEKYNKNLRLQYEQKISTLLNELSQYKDQEAGSTGKQIDNQTDSKYLTSKLNDKQKQALAENIRYIMENTDAFCKDDFTLEKLASMVNSNYKYVSQVINETYQKNFSNFINEYRIQEARIRLMDTTHYGNYTIQAIAESVGYKSQSTFINAFRKITGIPPSIYQKMAKEQCD
ncbi:tetratricopeptide repeat protein [Oscillospiraceae bacterium N12]|jgi:AraC-like DNA-binding protein|uniref:Tetratricopeptide repeat protein n=1 Tax=Jilunia laotingensis TaxID=2763675 RepID=A0A926IP23_9BACT|nr:helix-turn-helix domain-containing protein [Jilunia laotingensis]MBC8592829.1 tetratricopeptide repeat protein [Jilunia laotingensis]